MKEIELDELKKLQIDILDNINEFCKKNKINYWIDCGTLLGAIKYKGFIPWDDDIDIGMLREDYDKFQKIYNDSNKKYRLYTVDNDKDYCFPFGKVLDTRTILYEPDETGIKSGVYIDVFVYDNAPDDESLCQKMFDKRDLYTRLNTSRIYPNKYDHSSLKKRIIRFLLKIYFSFLPKNFYVKKIIKNSKKYVNEETKRVGNFTSAKRMTGNKKIFDSFIDVTFENKKYPAPVGYKDWLMAFYGDYSKDPPKEMQVSLHKFKAYYKGENDE